MIGGWGHELTTQRSCLFPGVSVPWLLNFASRTTIRAILSYTRNIYTYINKILNHKKPAAIQNSINKPPTRNLNQSTQSDFLLTSCNHCISQRLCSLIELNLKGNISKLTSYQEPWSVTGKIPTSYFLTCENLSRRKNVAQPSTAFGFPL